MRRICFLGNSHLGAVKLALDQARAEGLLGDAAVDTFGSHSTTLSTCLIEDGVLVPTEDFVSRNFAWTSGGRTRVELRSYDDIFVVAGWSPYSLVRCLAPGMMAPPSAALCRAVVEGWATDWAGGLGQAIARDAPGTAVHFVGGPELCEAARRAKGVRLALLKDGAIDAAKLAGLRQVQAVIAEAVARTQTAYASVARFPPTCLDEWGLFTREEFARRAAPLPDGEAETGADVDLVHMNGAYGLQLLHHLGVAKARDLPGRPNVPRRAHDAAFGFANNP